MRITEILKPKKVYESFIFNNIRQILPAKLLLTRKLTNIYE